MSARVFQESVSIETVRLMVLGYGLDHPYRVVSLDEIVHGAGVPNRDLAKAALEVLAQEGLVTRFSGRYCFNRSIPAELRRIVEKSVGVLE
ncbi:MAG TPA: hypothetical protein VKM94_01030 [Blastocatellia bacterium]|nr:hypothetical protein [Blastocatellia bacterium]